MNKLTKIIGNKMIVGIDNLINDSISDSLTEHLKTQLETHVFTRFDDTHSHCFAIWSQLFNELIKTKPI
jgi:hypothetical protein